MTRSTENPEFGPPATPAAVPRYGPPVSPPYLSQPRSRRPLGAFLVGLALLVLGAAVAVVLVTVTGSDGPHRTTAKSVVDSCDSSGTAIDLGGDEKSFTFTYRPGRTESIAIYECILAETDPPSVVDSRLGETRAIDGTQQIEGDGWEMYWNYHPDSGAGITISEK